MANQNLKILVKTRIRSFKPRSDFSKSSERCYGSNRFLPRKITIQSGHWCCWLSFKALLSFFVAHLHVTEFYDVVMMPVRNRKVQLLRSTEFWARWSLSKTNSDFYSRASSSGDYIFSDDFKRETIFFVLFRVLMANFATSSSIFFVHFRILALSSTFSAWIMRSLTFDSATFQFSSCRLLGPGHLRTAFLYIVCA